MNKKLFTRPFIGIMTAALLLSACSQDGKTSSTIKVNSLAELPAQFDEIDYHLDKCTADECSVPRMTFNKVDTGWKDASANLPVKVKKWTFFSVMAPLILISNEKIEAERKIVKEAALNSSELKAIAVKYKLIKNKEDALDENMRKQLLERVDIIPPVLALAQGAEESGWGTSRFAAEGNAFFGQWDFTGKGMKPKEQRAHLGNYGVARFDTPLACVEGYMININSGNNYQKLRTLRAQLRAQKQPVTGYALAGTLDKYSERGQAYADGLQKMINFNKLAPLDNAKLDNNHEYKIVVQGK